MRASTRVRTLVLYADYTTRLSYYDDWLDAFQQTDALETDAFNICQRDAGAKIGRRIQDYDLIVLLHSTNGDTTTYVEPLVETLNGRRGILMSFVGNEVNLPGSSIAEKRKLFLRLAPDFIATQLLQEAGDYLWGDLAKQGVLTIPHALNPEAFQSRVSQKSRWIDIGNRSVRYLPHLGDNDRNGVLDYFSQHRFDPHLRVDIGDQRLNRKNWAHFLDSCKATVSNEAGSWYLERDDHTVEAIRRWTKERTHRLGLVIKNDSRLRKLGHKLPWGLRVFIRRLLSGGLIRHESSITESLPFDEVYERFFSTYLRPDFYGKCISSRHFDAIGTETLQIMLRGRYNDILIPNEHYVALDEDFSNIAEVMAQFYDLDYRTRMVKRTREYVLDCHTYAHRIQKIVDTVSAVR